MADGPTSFEPKRIYAMSVISSVADQVESSLADPAVPNENRKSANENKMVFVNNDLKGVMSDKIHFEDFCYNYQNYVLEESIQLSNNFRKSSRMTKDDLKNRLADFFSIDENEACLLFFSGHGNDCGNFILETRDGEELLSIRELLALWDNRHKRRAEMLKGKDPSGKEYQPVKNKNNHLFLILDFCYSGQWVFYMSQLRKKRYDISIQASCNQYEPSNDQSNFGGLFINNFLHVNGYGDIKYNYQTKFPGKGPGGKDLNVQSPTAWGNTKVIWDIYRIHANFTGWDIMTKRARKPPEGEFIFKNGDRYIGQFKSVQLHGEGKKLFRNGTVIEGNFINDKQEGHGSISLNNGFICEGIFKTDQIYSFYEAILTTGEICKGDNYMNELRNGKAKFFLKDCELYEGPFLKGDYEGFGKLFFENGSFYVGEFEKDRKTGIGIDFFYKQTDDVTKKWFKTLTQVKEGRLEDGKMKGEIFTFSNTAQMILLKEYNADQAAGQSIFRYKNGTAITCNFKNGKMEPNLIYVQSKKANKFELVKYTGTTNADLKTKHGFGRNFYMNRCLFIGTYAKNLEVEGTFMFNRRCWYRGHWSLGSEIVKKEIERIEARRINNRKNTIIKDRKDKIEQELTRQAKNLYCLKIKDRSVRDGEFSLKLPDKPDYLKVHFFCDELI